MTEVRITLLGGFHVEFGRRSITTADFERRSGAELVQLLSLSPGRRMHREKVLDALWPDAPLASSANRLHKAATYARKALDVENSLVLRGEIVELLPDMHVQVDVATIAEAVRSPSDDIESVVSLCGGELLPDSPYVEWTVVAREESRRQQISLLKQARHWRRIIELDPAHEEAYIELMTQAVNIGDRTDALLLFRDLQGALDEHLGVEPSHEAVALRDQAESLDAQRAMQSSLTGNRVRRPEVAIIGRERERAELDLARQSHRLVTLVGAGGSGKTHLALHTAADAADTYGDDIWVAEFGEIQDDAAVGQQLLAAIGGQRHTDTSVEESIVRTLADRAALLVFDNCEHVRIAAASVLGLLLQKCPEVRIIATSREALDVPGERLYPLISLARTSAVELFCARASEQGVVLDPADATIDRICSSLDDLPLAIELAAARIRSSSVGEIEDMLDERFAFLTSSGAEQREHHETLAAAIAWSIDALGPGLFITISDLSVFAGSFGIRAARAVVGRDNNIDVAAQLDELVRRSVLLCVDVDGESRYRLLESVRLYVRGLSPNDDAADRHLDYVLERVGALDRDHDDRPSAAIAAYSDEWADIRKAFAHAADTGQRLKAVRLLSHCGVAALMQTRFEYLDWAERVFTPEVEPADPVEARAVAGWAALLALRSDYKLGSELAERALAAAPDDDLARTAVAWSHSAAGDVTEADDLLRELVDVAPTNPSMLRANATVLRTIFAVINGRVAVAEVEDLRLYAAAGDDVYEMALRFVTGCNLMRSDPGAALVDLQASEQLADRLGFDMCSIANRSLLAIGTTRIGSPTEGLEAVREALSWAGERGMWSSALNDLTTAAIVLGRAGRPEVATMLLSAREHSGFAQGFGTARSGVAEQVRPDDPDLFEHCWNRGRTLSPRSATMYAVRTIDELLADD
ncbi:MAG: BTAD domain-containing putative transcriptional regulator [Acidimicrobiia bacterium]|nr:BTAD domain-containing putative transcriptional regulator [Acidimicrobiia bacterium]